jgi:hypothetical protein
MYIAIDSNSLMMDWRFRSSTVRSFLQYLRSTDSRLLLSDVVRIEIEANFKRDCRKALEALNSALRNLRRFGIEEPTNLDIESVLAAALSTWKQDVADILSENIIEQISIDGDLMRDIVLRLAERIPPSSPKGEEFRDCVIWLSLLKHAQNNPNHSPLVLISNDGGFSTDRISLRPELQAELTEQKLSILYYSSLESFLKAQSVEVPEVDISYGGEVRLIDGSLSVQGLSGGPLYHFIGSQFSIRNNGADKGNVGAQQCFAGRVGEHLSLDSTFVGTLGLGSGPATIKGKEYPRLFYSGEIDFYGGTEIIDIPESAEFCIIGKFTFSGSMKGYESNPFGGDPGSSVFDVNLTGSGTAIVKLFSYPDTTQQGRLCDFLSITYNFEP